MSLFIEDDSAIREELALLLENEEYRHLPAANFTIGPEQAAQERPNLILLNIGLPELIKTRRGMGHQL